MVGALGSVKGVTGELASLMNGAPLLRLDGCGTDGKLGTHIIMGLRCFGPTKDIGSHVTLTVVRSTRSGKVLGPNTAVVRPADNGANIKLTFISTSGKCGLVLAVPSAVDMRQEGLLGTLKTRLMLAPNTSKVGNTVTGTRRLGTGAPNTIVLRRFRGPTGPTIRIQAAKRRV